MNNAMAYSTAFGVEINGLIGSGLHIVHAQCSDCDAVVSLFGALHAYNASLDPHFALAVGWAVVAATTATFGAMIQDFFGPKVLKEPK